jgi:uncharacterized BrkB/YihY/UPF0761 family membrane protein
MSALRKTFLIALVVIGSACILLCLFLVSFICLAFRGELADVSRTETTAIALQYIGFSVLFLVVGVLCLFWFRKK